MLQEQHRCLSEEREIIIVCQTQKLFQAVGLFVTSLLAILVSVTTWEGNVR